MFTNARILPWVPWRSVDPGLRTFSATIQLPNCVTDYPTIRGKFTKLPPQLRPQNKHPCPFPSLSLTVSLQSQLTIIKSWVPLWHPSQHHILSVWNQRKKTWTEHGWEPGMDRSFWKAQNHSPCSKSPEDNRFLENKFPGMDWGGCGHKNFLRILPST